MAGKHALVVVHGMGSSKKGSNLRNAAKHLLSAIDRRRDPDARLDVSSSSMDADIPYVDIRHRDDIYHIEEYWWAESFSPASAPAISWWIATRATRHLWHFAAKSAGNLKAFGLRTVSALPFVDFNATSRIDNITSLNRQAATEARAARGLDRSKPRNTLAGLYICVLLTLGIPVAVLGPLLLLVMIPCVHPVHQISCGSDQICP
jgi:hypothetical protein